MPPVYCLCQTVFDKYDGTLLSGVWLYLRDGCFDKIACTYCVEGCKAIFFHHFNVVAVLLQRPVHL